MSTFSDLAARSTNLSEPKKRKRFNFSKKKLETPNFFSPELPVW